MVFAPGTKVKFIDPTGDWSTGIVAHYGTDKMGRRGYNISNSGWSTSCFVYSGMRAIRKAK